MVEALDLAPVRFFPGKVFCIRLFLIFCVAWMQEQWPEASTLGGWRFAYRAPLENTLQDF